MRLHDGRYECAHCGAVLDIPLLDRAPQVTIYASSGQPNRRVLKLDNREIHSCEIGERHPVGGGVVS